jgi:hypothetical protein
MLPILLWSQKINHFNNINSKWNVAKSYPAGNLQHPSFVATTTTVYGFKGDTIINSSQWFKLYSTNDSAFQNNLVYNGLIRAENNMVFFIDTLNQYDTLYNFNLNLGDSVLFKMHGVYPEWLEIIKIDSVQINGEFYKRLKFEEPSVIAFDELNEIWIEGIGSIHGPLFPNYPRKFSQEIPDSAYLICTYSDNNQIWNHPFYSSCYVKIVLNINNPAAIDFNIYPNPFLDKIYIEFEKNQSYDLSLINNLGQIIREIEVKSNKQSIDLSELKAGVYYLRISGANKTKTVKIIKKS